MTIFDEKNGLILCISSPFCIDNITVRPMWQISVKYYGNRNEHNVVKIIIITDIQQFHGESVFFQ